MSTDKIICNLKSLYLSENKRSLINKISPSHIMVGKNYKNINLKIPRGKNAILSSNLNHETASEKQIPVSTFETHILE